MEQTLSELVVFLKDVSPMVWETVLKQVRIDALGFLGGTIPLAFLTGILWNLARRAKNLSHVTFKGGWWDDAFHDYLEFSILATISTSITAMLLYIGFSRIYNSEYYAIKMILEQIVP